MKQITIALDGVADRPNKLLDNKTPLEYAHTPNLDELAKKSTLGRVVTIPKGLEVGSAVGNMSLLGLDTSTYRGRAAVEAAGLRLKSDEDDLFIRVNLVTFEGDSFENSRIKSYSAYEIETEVAQPVAEALAKEVYGGEYELNYVGSFRFILIVKGGKKLYPIDFMPAHDIIGQDIGPFIKREGKEAPFFALMEKSYDFLRNKGIAANGVWFWGASIMPEIRTNVSGRIALAETLLMDGITAISGIPIASIEREGRNFDDFLKEKLCASLDAAKAFNDVYIHIQEPDDLSHEMMPVEKMHSIETFDKVFLPTFLDGMDEPYTLKIASDHFTFSDTGAHGGDPVPFLCYNSEDEKTGEGRLTEADCEKTRVLLTARELKELV